MNAERRIRAQYAIDAYAERAGNTDEPPADNLVDLLTDVLHLCRKESVDFDAVVETALMHFEAEIE